MKGEKPTDADVASKSKKLAPPAETEVPEAHKSTTLQPPAKRINAKSCEAVYTQAVDNSKHVAKEGAKAKEGSKAKQGSKEGAKDGAKEGAMEGANAKEGSKAKEGAKDGAKHKGVTKNITADKMTDKDDAFEKKKLLHQQLNREASGLLTLGQMPHNLGS